MSRKAPSRDIDERDLEVEGSAHAAAGVTAVAVSMKRSIEQMGVRRTAQTLLRLNQADGLRLPGLRVARPRPGAPPHRRVLRERRQGGRRGGHPAPGRARSSSPSTRWPTSPTRPTTGWASRAGSPSRWSARGRHALRADLVGRGLRADRAPPARPGQPRRGRLLHVGPDLERGGVRLPALRAGLRHQQPARLLEHVPRVDRRSRSPSRSASARRSVTLDDVHDAELIVIAGQNPGTNHPRMLTALEIAKKNGAKIVADQPAARGRAGALQEPAERPRRGRRTAPGCRPAPAGAHQRRPRAVPGARVAAASRWDSARPATSSTSTPPASRTGREHVREPRLGPGRASPPA